MLSSLNRLSGFCRFFFDPLSYLFLWYFASFELFKKNLAFQLISKIVYGGDGAINRARLESDLYDCARIKTFRVIKHGLDGLLHAIA